MKAAVVAIYRAVYILWVLLRYNLLCLLPNNMRPLPLKILQGLVITKRSVAQEADAVRLRLAFEQLGPIFVKFGQLLATRRDLLPLEVANELSKLQEAVTPFSGAQPLIEKSLGGPVTDFFQDFDPKPLASASIAQVHTAKLANQEAVVIKILRPNIQKKVQQDIHLLRWAANLLSRMIPELNRFHLKSIVNQYDSIIHKELDLRLEAKNALKFAENFTHSKDLYVPKVYPEFTRENLLVLERVYGTPIDDIASLKAQGVNLKVLAVMGVEIFFAQVFRDNFFHADMHPGNIHVDTSNPQAPRYISLDCAIVGELDRLDQLLLGRKLLALLRKDFMGVAQLMVTGQWVPKTTDTFALAATLEKLLTPMLSGSLANIEFGPLLINLFQAARQFDLQALPQFMLLEKTLIHVEGLGKQLDPHLDVFAIGQPLLEAWVREKLGPKAMLTEFEKAWPRWLEYAAQGPSTLTNMIKTHQIQQQSQLEALQILLNEKKSNQRAARLWPWQLLAAGTALISLSELIQASSLAALISLFFLGGLSLFWLRA